MGTDSKVVHFSNTVLEGFLKYVAKYHNTARYQDFIQSLGVSSTWLADPTAWHDAAFLDRFFRSLQHHFPEHPEIAFEGAKFLFAQKKLQRFTSLAGLLLQPHVVFSKLSTSSSRMNLYNTYEFKMGVRRLAYSSGKLTQRYFDPSMKELNGHLCDASRGSIAGMMGYLGHRVLELREPVCVKKGGDHCEYEVTWINRPLFRQAAIGALIAGGAWLFQERLLQTEPVHSALTSLLLALVFISWMSMFRHRKSLAEAFEYQDAALGDLRRASASLELLNEKLIDYQKQLNETLSMASLGELSFSVMHDMASPTTLLNYYSGELSSAMKNKFPDESESLKYCSAIEKATQRILKLQALFRSTAKSQHAADPIENDLRTVVLDCVDLFKPVFKRNEIRLEVSTPDEPVQLETYEGCLETITLNLVQNAINAMADSPERKLVVCLEDLGEVALLSIRDSGPGIPKERLANIWQRFGKSGTTQDESARYKVGGSGFGLYSIKKVVDRVQGQIEVESSRAGTIFSMEFPKRLEQRRQRALAEKSA